MTEETNKFDGREIFTYHPIEEGNPPKPEAVRFYMPRRREWSEINTANLLKFGVRADDIDAIEKGDINVMPRGSISFP